MNHISMSIYNDPSEAPNYNELAENGDKISKATLTNAYVVKNGTREGNATIDLIFVDESGNKYVSMVTANLLKMVCSAA